MKIFTFTKLGRTLLLAAVLVVGAVCWAGCGGGDDNNPADNNGNNSGSNNGGGNNTVNNCGKDGTADSCKTKTMPDGKMWMTENLNVETTDSWCYNDSNSYCNKYGRLYTWAAALTACPSGWHLPTRDEWGALAKAAGGTGDYGVSGTAGKKLRSKSGWNNYGGKSGNGTDEFGFSALPGGDRFLPSGEFGHAGYNSDWWAAEGSGGYAYYRYTGYGFDEFGEYNYDVKSYGYSVRCVAD